MGILIKPRQHIIRASDGVRGRLYDLEEGKEIKGVIWANLDNGNFCAYQLGSDSKPLVDRQGNRLTYTAIARLKWVPRQAPFPEVQPVRHSRKHHEKLQALMLDRRCMHYGCIKVAEWMVGDEVELPEQVVYGGNRWKSGRLVNVRYYCGTHRAQHHPLLYDGNGEVIKSYEAMGHPDIVDYGKGR